MSDDDRFTFDFPVDRVGDFNNLGRAKARFLGEQQAEYLTAEADDGTFAYKRGSFLNVESEEQGIDGFLIGGRLNGSTNTSIFGSTTGRGTFAFRGPAPPNPNVPSADAYGALITYGRARAEYIDAQPLGYKPNFDGQPCYTYGYRAFLTANGRRVQERYQYELSVPFNGIDGYIGGGSYPIAGAWSLKDGQYAFRAGTTTMQLFNDGQMALRYIIDDRGSITYGTTFFIENQLAFYMEAARVGPSAIFAVNKYVRRYYSDPDSLVVDADCPGVFFTYSTDAGTSWNVIADDELISEFKTTRDTLTIPVLWFNQYVDFMVNAVAPVSPSRAIVYSIVPYSIDGTADGSYKAKVKLGVLNMSGAWTINETAVLYEGSLQLARRYHTGTNAVGGAPALVAVPGGALLSRITEPENAEWWKLPRQLCFTDGYSVTPIAFMPFAAYRCGEITALAPNVLVCPMYDDVGYCLYESRNGGILWTRRAIITTQGTPPDENDPKAALQNFQRLVFLSLNNVPVNPTPATPWVSDARITPPP